MAKISQNKMATLFQRLATSYKAGIDIRSAVKREAQIGSPAYQQKMKTVVRALKGGGSLADALGATDGYFPELVVSVVKAGEVGGRLEDSFARLGKHYKDLVTFRNNFLRAIAWPAFEMLFAVLIIGLLMAICDWIFSSLKIKPFDWFWMGSTAGNVIAYYVLAAMFAATATMLVVGTMRGWFGALPLKLAMKIPLIGSTIRCLALSRFAWTMSVADNAGMNALDIAELSLNSTENFYYTQFKPQVKDSLRAGNQFYPTFRDTEAFPDDLLIQIDNGETAGQLAESMALISEDYQKRAEANLEAIGKIGFILMMLFVGGLVAFILIFAISQYANLINGLAQPNAF
jgi:type IV pilus assembly protein PilC